MQHKFLDWKWPPPLSKKSSDLVAGSFPYDQPGCKRPFLTSLSWATLLDFHHMTVCTILSATINGQNLMRGVVWYWYLKNQLLVEVGKYSFGNIQSTWLVNYHDTLKKHCQRHNGPEGWVHITSYYTNLDKTISEFWLSINFQISTKHQYLD